MKSYIKIFGPPYIEAIRALERTAVSMPQVCIWDTQISYDIPVRLAHDVGGRAEWTRGYYNRQGVVISGERCQSIISNSGDSLGEYDFFFEWYEEPSITQLETLIDTIDKELEPLGCRYSITNK
jgi:hypothetical protein